MKITLYGAAGEVTGSAYHLQTNRASLLVDFGLFQGGKMTEKRNRAPRGLNARQLDAVVLTHAHLDHSGRLPLLAKQGYSGPIYGTPATLELSALILHDAAKIQAQDNERLNRKRERAGEPPLQPLFTAGDVETALKLFRPAPYDQPVAVAPGVQARFVEAGHILGSTSIELTVEEEGQKRVLVFSGDLGPRGAPILKDAAPFKQADVVFLESTYGDRDHRPLTETIAEFEAIIKTAVERRGKILAPAFAVGRTQLLLYLLAVMFRRQVTPKFPIYLDSPMAIEATRIYLRHPELADEEVQALRQVKPLQEDLDTMRATVTAAESRALNDLAGPCLIIAGAGMCNAGRILHHLKQNLWKPQTSVLIVGYQVEGSLGRQLVEGREQVTIFGEKIAVRAAIHTLGGFSAHAGQSDLAWWFDPLAPSRPRVILTHGEDKGRRGLARLLADRYRVQAELPELGHNIEVF